MIPTVRIKIAVFMCLIFVQVLTVKGQEAKKEKEWKGRLIDGTIITLKELKKKLADHKQYLSNPEISKDKRIDLCQSKLSDPDLQKAKILRNDLRGVDLTGANLRKARLCWADLSGANLRDANLRDASMAFVLLHGADLTGANLEAAELRDASLTGADLTGANLNLIDLVGADLSNAKLRSNDMRMAKLIAADLTGADLTGANLTGADLSSAILIGANLTGAKLRAVNLNKTDASFSNFENSLFLPVDVNGMVFMGAKGLSTLVFDDFHRVVELRKIAKESGLRNEERALTASLRKYRLKGTPFGERFFETIFIDIPTDYGANPWRCIQGLGMFIFIFTVFYFISLKRRGTDGIWQVWIEERVRKDIGEAKPIYLKLRGLSALKTAFYFSLLSAFSIGWRELNIGNWISRIQRREYTLRATGWTRTVSGIQSLLSVYFLALWAITYFSRPFG